MLENHESPNIVRQEPCQGIVIRSLVAVLFPHSSILCLAAKSSLLLHIYLCNINLQEAHAVVLNVIPNGWGYGGTLAVFTYHQPRLTLFRPPPIWHLEAMHVANDHYIHQYRSFSCLHATIHWDLLAENLVDASSIRTCCELSSDRTSSPVCPNRSKPNRPYC